MQRVREGQLKPDCLLKRSVQVGLFFVPSTVADVPYIGACGDGLVCVCKSPRKLGKRRRLFADVGMPMYMHVCAHAYVSLPAAM